MLADASLDLFVVATPNATHFELTSRILSSGKNVVVDKPMAVTSGEIAELMRLAESKGLLVAPFHNRRWDSDFQTIQNLLREGILGRLVGFESRFDRWRPNLPTTRLWKEDPESGGLLLDLGTHLVDQALQLFGKPLAVGADVRRERAGLGSNDAFELRLRYPEFLANLGANCLSLPAGARFCLRGTSGNYLKHGVDLQEAALGAVTRIGDAHWGREPAANWGIAHIGIDGGEVSHPVEPVAGDYRLFYIGIRDALLTRSRAPVTAVDAWRAARVLEWAQESSQKRCEIACDWSGEPE